jgi:hypothetical protein
MPRSIHRNRPLARLFGQAAAILAFVAQVAMLAAGWAEGRDGVGYGAHFDRGGTSTHNETLCAACQARSLHGIARIPQAPPPAVAPEAILVDAVPAPFFGRDRDTTNLSRAPPVVI